MAVLNKAEVLDVLVRLTGENRQTCEKVYSATVDTFHDALLSGHEIKIHGFGVLTTKLSNRKSMTNPSTGEVHDVPARLIPFMRWSISYKKKFLGGGDDA